MNQQNQTFEEKMHRLEQIVRAMERGDVALEESLKLFQEGTALVESCGKLLDEAELQEIPDLAPSVADEYARREEIEQIQKILHDVSEPYKEVFMWRVYAELSFKQIAQIFGKTENWACVTYHRARKMIKERLEEKNGEN